MDALKKLNTTKIRPHYYEQLGIIGGKDNDWKKWKNSGISGDKNKRFY